MKIKIDNELLSQFESIKDTDEQILWVDRPTFIPYILSSIGGLIFAIAFSLFWIYTSLNFENNAGNDSSQLWALFGLIPLVSVLYHFLSKVFSFRNTYYAYSNRRVMIRSGAIGTDFKIIDYDKILDMEVTVNAVEKAYKLGSIRFFSGKTEEDEGNVSKVYEKWEAIENPYHVFKAMKQVSLDNKTSHTSQNAVKPEFNSEYPQ